MTQQAESNNDQGEWLTLGNMSWKIPNQMIKEVDEEVVTEDERGDVETTEDETEELPLLADVSVQAESINDQGTDKKPLLWEGCAENIGKEAYPKWLANLKNEPGAINQHYCLLHRQDLLVMEAEIFGRPCHSCSEDLAEHHILHCYTCDFNICDKCHAQEHQKFIQTRSYGELQMNKKLEGCPTWMQEEGAVNYHTCPKHPHPLIVRTSPVEGAYSVCNTCQQSIANQQPFLRCMPCDLNQCGNCHDEIKTSYV